MKRVYAFFYHKSSALIAFTNFTSMTVKRFLTHHIANGRVVFLLGGMEGTALTLARTGISDLTIQ